VKILLTGASSFTGMHFARALADAGHDVTCTLTKGLGDYGGVRKIRISCLPGKLAFYTTFGSPRFMRLVEANGFDVLCHHGAQVGDYRDPDFDVPGAVQLDTNNGRRALIAMKANGLKAVVVTGSTAEPGEGGSEAMYPYGVAKQATASLFRHWCQSLGVDFGKFVVSNPFGPYEDDRLCSRMVAAWRRGERFDVATPEYVRNFTHVGMLAGRYAAFAAGAPGKSLSRCCPGGYAESVGDFALRYAREVGARLGLAAEVRLLEQVDFSEPMARVVKDAMIPQCEAERACWNETADYYRH
jgi:UDP-glucose 4-epimerase